MGEDVGRESRFLSSSVLACRRGLRVLEGVRVFACASGTVGCRTDLFSLGGIVGASFPAGAAVGTAGTCCG